MPGCRGEPARCCCSLMDTDEGIDHCHWAAQTWQLCPRMCEVEQQSRGLACAKTAWPQEAGWSAGGGQVRLQKCQGTPGPCGHWKGGQGARDMAPEAVRKGGSILLCKVLPRGRERGVSACLPAPGPGCVPVFLCVRVCASMCQLLSPLSSKFTIYHL